MLPVVDVVIINWNGIEDTIDCLRSLKGQSYIGGCRAILIDNCSADESLIIIKAWCKKECVDVSEYQYRSSSERMVFLNKISNNEADKFSVSLISADENLGFCTANNIGVEFSIKNSGELSFILNNDTVCDSELISHLVDASINFNHECILSPVILYADSPDIIWWQGGRFSKWLSPTYVHQGNKVSETISEPVDTEWSSGCATLIPNSLYKKIGLYDPEFFIWCDEWDFSLRAEIYGVSKKVISSAKLYHKVGKSLGIVSPLVYFYSFRNMSILRKRYLSKTAYYLFNGLYVPFKFFQSILYSLKERDVLYFIIFFDVVFEGVSSGRGKWKRQSN
ncbi:MAG: glycosyltransferase family 2 protein [Gammaproteobacteria bacterium]|nr:glycosyltransferase family 2 protein [Gammaproteobacteria bacterium]